MGFTVDGFRRNIWKHVGRHATAVGGCKLKSVLALFQQEQPEAPEEKAESVPDQPVEEA